MGGVGRAVSARPTLDTARLRLRHPDERDVGAIVRLADDWEVARRLGRLPHPYTREDARYFLDEIVPAEWVWVIESPGGTLLGTVGLAPSADGASAELGYWLGRAHWGQGFATEAAGAVVAYAREALRLRKLTSGHFADNAASGRVLAKLGFAVSGPGHQFCMALGRAVPSVELRLDFTDGTAAPPGG